VIELLMMHGLSNLDYEQNLKVIQTADKLVYEPWEIQIGTELWRKLLGAYKGRSLVDSLVDLAKSDSENFLEIMQNVASL